MPHSIDVMVGKRIRLRRLQLSLSQTDLARKLDLTFQQVQKYEKGTNRVSCSRLYEIANILKVPVSFFFSDKADGRSEIRIAEHLEPNKLKDGLRLITAFGQIDDVKTRRKLLALVESIAAGAG